MVLPFALLLQQMSAGAMGGGVVSAVARAIGGGRPAEASALVLHAVLIATGFGLGFSLLLAVFPRAVLGSVGGAEAAEAAAGYAAWMFGAGAVPAWLANTLASVLRGGGRHALASRALLVAWLAFPPLAWALMEPAGLGLEGAGVAFAAVMTAAAGAQAVLVLRGAAGFVPDLRVRPRAALFGRILSVGLVACAMATIANLATILVTARAASHGAAAVAAFGISARIEFLMVPLAFGVGSALTALVGRAAGAGDWAAARRTAWTGGLLALALTGAVGLGGEPVPGSAGGGLRARPGGGGDRGAGARHHRPGAAGLRARHGALLRGHGGGVDALARRGGAEPDRPRGGRRMTARDRARRRAGRAVPGGGAWNHGLRGGQRPRRAAGGLGAALRPVSP